MKVTGIAIGEYKGLCKTDAETRGQIVGRILTAFILGEKKHTYRDKSYIVRYFDLNLLVSFEDEIKVIWRDRTRDFVVVSEDVKREMKFKPLKELGEIAKTVALKHKGE